MHIKKAKALRWVFAGMGGFNIFTSAKTEKKISSKGFTVYKGLVDGELVYIGTTIQKPEDRFRWHRNNGKAFKFEVIEQFDTEDEMLDKEFELIQKFRPKHNKITHRRQNLNKKLSKEVLDLRVGDKTWCQCCLKRRVNRGFSKCYYC